MNSSIYLGGIMDTTVISNGPRKSTVSRPPMPTEEDLGKYFKKSYVVKCLLPIDQRDCFMKFIKRDRVGT